MTQRQAYPSLVLHAQGLACGRGGLPLADDMSFAVQGGTCLLLRGPNGTGKTTLLLTLAGIVAPLAGSFAIEGADPEAGPLLHYCGHRNATKPRLSVAENLGFWAAVNGATGDAVEDALDRVGLGDLAMLDAGYLSAGQSRRLALARLPVTHRPVWLLDEPTAALDTEGHQLVTDLIDGHLDAGGIAIAATHDPITLPDAARMETTAPGKAV
ncbi:heme ABC exporter ATP-binding protein CcmA [Devosia sp. A8/3-2]|nr:heme ABC exporter ATP-binding protein CcmA [Devosia sp. A8/3-2]